MMPSGHGSRVATRRDELRGFVGEVEALAALLLEYFDHANWSDADPFLVERTTYVLGIIAQSVAAAASKLDGFHVADPQPATRGDAQRERTLANDLDAHEMKVLWTLRNRLAEVFGQSPSHPFFRERLRTASSSGSGSTTFRIAEQSLGLACASSRFTLRTTPALRPPGSAWRRSRC
jgi:hypothetical protein